jgi:hypothetical protein
MALYARQPTDAEPTSSTPSATRARARRRTYLIQDPYDDDAVQFIRTIFTCFGLRPICFYTDPKARFYGVNRYPLLSSDKIEASYDVSLSELGPFAAEMRQRYDIAGVVPYREDTVEVAAELVGALDLPWNSRDILARYRNKHALKCYLAERGVRVPASRLVRSAAELWASPVPDRFVLKPNDGLANRFVGIFDLDQRTEAEQHMAAAPHITWVLEEYIDGPEYHVNGQIRANGDISLLGVLAYLRAETNGYSTVYVAEHQVHTRHPAFARLTNYAMHLIRTSGLRACPFHMELKLDERGPCMVDVGARFPSEMGGHMLSRMHPRRPDVYTVAAHDYLGIGGFGDLRTDWTHYDQHTAVLVYGLSHQQGIVHSIDGVDDVERMPEFVNWPKKPYVGQALSPTRELGSEPYSVELVHQADEHHSLALVRKVHATVRINASSPASSVLRGYASHVLRRAGPKLRWWAHRVRR